MVVKPMIGLPKPLIKHYFLLFLLGILSLLPYCRCFANTSLHELLKLDIEQLVNERIVSLNKRPQQTFDLAASVYVFTRYDIQRTGALTVPDLLMRVPGVYVRQPTKQDATISIRNDNQFFNANMLLLIDGEALYSPVTNNFQWRLLPISVEDIERIEVIRGNGGIAWGTNASSGVVNIITRHYGDGPDHEVRAGIGNQGYRRAHAAISTQGLRVSAHGESDDGFPQNPENSDHQYVNTNYVNNIYSWNVFVSGNYYQQSIHNIESAFSQTPQTNHSNSYDLSAEATKQIQDQRVTLKTYYIDNTTDYALVGTKDIHQTTTDVELLYFKPLTDSQRLQIGSSYREYSSKYPSSPIVNLVPSKIDESLINATIDYENDLSEHFRSNVGLRYEDYSLIQKDHISVSARLSHLPNGSTALWTAFNHSYQFPSFLATNVSAITDTQNNVIVRQQGNTDLKAEQYDDIQLGLRHITSNNTFIDMVAHYVKVRDEIFIDPATATANATNTVITSEFTNHVSSNSYGGELILKQQLNQYYKTELGLTYFRKHAKTQDDLQRPTMNDQYAPKWKVTLSNDFRFTPKASGYLFLNWESTHHFESSSIYLPAESAAQRFRADGNLQLRYSPKVRLDIGFKNMFNKKVDWYYDFITSKPRMVEPSYYVHLLFEF